MSFICKYTEFHSQRYFIFPLIFKIGQLFENLCAKSASKCLENLCVIKSEFLVRMCGNNAFSLSCAHSLKIFQNNVLKVIR